ncbi:type II toxin-antitoxin system RelE/ParE family toxin [Devosia sp.]|uniref:type II toxin-antitoxin system RelE/ParE family toxin n=1 Tax=Devosia sp. TaxID=1871048 RepID=UPI002AFDE6CB|nr:type II toxin-antitoxin system RelE/ParE family toxin [Devosia sp.]
MKRRRIRYSPAAERDLEHISDWLADVASENTAIRYIQQIKWRIDTLEHGAERGTLRDPQTGLRVIGILASVSIAFTVDDDAVNIQRVIYGGQDWLAAPATQNQD